MRGLPDRFIRLIGLTGSMGTGKSTAAGFFRTLGVPVIDADELARKVVEPGRPALPEIVDSFGPGVLDSSGGLDRLRLAALVFENEALRARLEEILHPRIALEAEKQLEECVANSPTGFVVYDIPLLFETGQEGRFDLLVTVKAERKMQENRVASRSNLTPEDISKRLAAQIDIDEKVARSDVVLDNSTTLEALEKQVGELVTAIARHNSKKNRK